MPWYGWLIIGVLAAAVIFLLIAWLTKKTAAGLSESEKRKLLEIETLDIKQRLQAEKEERVRLKAILIQQKEANARLKQQLDEELKQIDSRKRENVKKLVADADLLSDELDKLAGVSTISDKDLTPKG
jgi:flagellar basal body-associated protein FliL